MRDTLLLNNIRSGKGKILHVVGVSLYKCQKHKSKLKKMLSKVVRKKNPLHGETQLAYIQKRTLFRGLQHEVGGWRWWAAHV